MADERGECGPGLPGSAAGTAAANTFRCAGGGSGPGPDLLLRLVLPAAVCQGLTLAAEQWWHHPAAGESGPLGAPCRSPGNVHYPLPRTRIERTVENCLPHAQQGSLAAYWRAGVNGYRNHSQSNRRGLLLYDWE